MVAEAFHDFQAMQRWRENGILQVHVLVFLPLGQLLEYHPYPVTSFKPAVGAIVWQGFRQQATWTTWVHQW